MFTRCTNCNTWFRLGQNDIRTAHGEVRCGACGARFNALASLCEELPAAALEGIAAEPVRPAEPPAPPPAEPVIDEQVGAWSEPAPADAPPEVVFEPEPAPEDPETLAEEVQAHETEIPPAPATPEKRRRRVPRWVWWTAGSVILLAVLISQGIIYGHAALRANPLTRGVIESLYSAFGHPLPPRHDINALTITAAQVSTTPAAPGALILTAALTNKADFAQAWPQLRVVLTDRFGSVVGRGLFGPRDYLPAHDADKLAAGATQPVRLKLADPGSNAVGFVVVPCLEKDTGPVCAGD
ncbi:MAG TPA: zinc-ribbon and DUF3426 domain-containing protein [Gammaproteobacteria bacterium]|nr:zinc-ribbon and DUF3426 domain-containing protein [Gammaproteobacteria bacterium]